MKCFRIRVVSVYSQKLQLHSPVARLRLSESVCVCVCVCVCVTYVWVGGIVGITGDSCVQCVQIKRICEGGECGHDCAFVRPR